MFGGRGKGWRAKYWEVGRVTGLEAEWEGPVRELCEPAQQKRPGTDEGEASR